MDQQLASALLGLAESDSVSVEQIEQAWRSKCAEIEQKRTAAPTEALKAKFDDLLVKVDLARSSLLSIAAPSPTPAPSIDSPRSSSPLSKTKLADLPQAGASGTGFKDDEQPGSQLSLQPGMVLAGRYEIKERIGAGGMGAVYHALDKTRQQDIAIKVLLPALLKSERARERFLSEAKLSSQLSHPNIVNVFDVQQDGDYFFLTMELLEGQNLRSWLDSLQLLRQPVEIAEAKRIAAELCDALSHAHELTVHRDIKPENIWLDGKGRVKLMDFGIARVQSASQRSKSGAVLGTAYYMAPEQLQGRSDVDGRADLYAVGVLLYEMLTGQVPAGRIEPAIKLRKDMGKALSQLIDQLLSANPDQRPATAAELKDKLLSGKGGGVGIALPEFGGGKAIAAGVVLFLVLLGGGVATGAVGSLWEAIKPVSEAERMAMQADAVRAQTQVNSLLRDMETARRNLAADLRDAERSRHSNLAKLQRWHESTDIGIFSAGQLNRLEGDRAVAEVLLREKNYQLATEHFLLLQAAIKHLYENFMAASDLYQNEALNHSEKEKWNNLKRAYRLVDNADVERAQALEGKARAAEISGELVGANLLWLDAANHWGKAVADPSVASRINQVKADAAREKQQEEERRARQLRNARNQVIEFLRSQSRSFSESVSGSPSEKVRFTVRINERAGEADPCRLHIVSESRVQLEYQDYEMNISYEMNMNLSEISQILFLSRDSNINEAGYEAPFHQYKALEMLVRIDGRAQEVVNEGYSGRYTNFSRRWVNVNKTNRKREFRIPVAHAIPRNAIDSARSSMDEWIGLCKQ